MKDTPTIPGKVPKFASLLLLITNQNFYTTIPMTRSSKFWGLAICLFIGFLCVSTPSVTAKTRIAPRVETTNLVDINLYASRKTAPVDEVIDIEITTGNFSNVEDMIIPMAWNPALLQFQSIKDLSTDIPAFTLANFTTTNVATGSLQLRWRGTPSRIADGERFFTITFKVKAYSGLPASIIFNTLGADGLAINTSGNTSSTITTSTGSVRIIDTNPCPPRAAGLSCQTAPLLSASEFPYYSTLPAANTTTIPSGNNICPASIENNHWVAFTAASTALTLKVGAANSSGGGVQFFIYETTDCSIFQKTFCHQSGILAGEFDDAVLTGLTIGTKYYIMLDGQFGDRCDYTIAITSGQVQNTVQTIPDQTISGPSLACNSPSGLTFSIPSVTNADSYLWRFPSSATAATPTSGANQTSITLNWGTVSDSVCVRIASRCDTTKWFCKTVKAGATIKKDTTVRKCAAAPYLFDGINRFAAGEYTGSFFAASGCDSIVTLRIINDPAITKELTAYKCAQDVYKFDGIDRREEGDYTATFLSAAGCDSIVTLHLFNYPLSSKSIDTTICSGTSIVVGGRTFGTPFNSTVNVPRGSFQGCDSIIYLKLTVIDFLLPAPTKSNDIRCTIPQATLTGTVQNQPVNAILSYEWKNESGTVVGTAATAVVNQGGIFTLTVTAKVNDKTCSKSTTISVTKSGNQPNKPSIAGATTTCDTRTEIYNLVAPVANTLSYNWTNSDGTFTRQTNQITASWNANATTSKVCISAQNACGVSDTACVSVEIGRIPTPLSITGNTAICPNTTVTYRVTPLPNTTLLWSVASGAAQNTLITDSLQVRWATTNGRITVTPGSRCGTGTTTDLDVQISNVLPDSVPIQGIATPCSNDTTVYSVANSASVTEYLWQVPSGATILRGQGTRTISVVWGNFSNNSNIFLTTKNACQLARGVTFAVNVKKATLATSIINGNRTVCPNTQISFSTPALTDIRRYTWTVPPDATILRGANSDSIRVDWASSPSGDVCLEIETICGAKQKTCTSIEVRADLDSLVISGGSTVCKDSTLRFCVPDDGSALRFLWQIPSITGGTIISGQGTNCINVRFATTSGTVRVIPVGGCSDSKLSRKDISVTSPPAITSLILGKTTVCNNAIETFSVIPQSDISRYVWRFPSNITFIGDSTGSNVTVRISNTATSGFVTVQGASNCGLSNGVTARLAILQRPQVNAGIDTSICSNTYTLRGSTNGAVKTWSVVSKPVGSVATFASADKSQTNVTVTREGQYVFRFEESNGGECSMADSVAITFHNLPTATLVDQNCNQEATQYRVQVSVSGAGAPFSIGGSVFGRFQGATFLSDTIASGTPYFFIVTDAFGCKSDSIKGTKECPCYTSAGQLRADSLVVCYGSTGKAVPQGDAKLDVNDVSEYFLHTGTATRIGNILSRNKTGIFGFDPTLVTYNRVYYITFVVGDQQPNGNIDTTKRCVSQTRGIPIIFKEDYTASLTGDTTVCRFAPVQLRFNSSQTGFFDITYQSTVGNNVVVRNVQSPANINVNTALSATYKLVSAVDKNGCRAQLTDSARVNLRPLPISNAGADRSVCSTTVQMDAAENFSYIGEWKSLTAGVVITDPADPRSLVTNLQNGRNVLVWIVSDTACLSYLVRDTVQIFVPLLPKANNLSLITQVGVSVTGNVSESAPFGTYSVTRLTNPTNGRFDLFSNGSFTYIPEAKFEGIVKFKYVTCSDLCTQLCDTGEVRILVQPRPDTTKFINIDVPNAITPNGDGKNDALVIEGIDQFSENELVVFSRWGDILYKSKPYKNDWQGTNQSGAALPEGTYYYVLRLNTADGKVLRGDMTILR
ncbi:MAG: gliding motility-associated C-terminal domain-containing protein [Saprospiraceae bacterium]|nr:gliding motility-associated C-terminal domain-containing protein [Saprospiraceae bacterium]